MLPWLALALLVIFLDQLTKIVVERTFSFGDDRPVTSFFNLVLTYNKGAAFSFLASASGWQDKFLTVVGLAASAFILYLLARHGHQRLFCVWLWPSSWVARSATSSTGLSTATSSTFSTFTGAAGTGRHSTSPTRRSSAAPDC